MLTVAMSALIVTVGAKITASDQGGAFREGIFIEGDVRRIWASTVSAWIAALKLAATGDTIPGLIRS
jgi:hypothetical protein